MSQPNAAPCRPRRNSDTSATTIANDTIHVISAGVLPRWKPLTHPHHAQSATSPATLEVRRVPTGPV